MLFFGFLASRYLGQGSMTLLPATLLPNWFAHRRPLAFSLMSVGGVVGSTFLPPLNRFLIDTFGWRMVWRIGRLLLLPFSFRWWRYSCKTTRLT
jgi:MFS family permease